MPDRPRSSQEISKASSVNLYAQYLGAHGRIAMLLGKLTETVMNTVQLEKIAVRRRQVHPIVADIYMEQYIETYIAQILQDIYRRMVAKDPSAPTVYALSIAGATGTSQDGKPTITGICPKLNAVVDQLETMRDVYEFCTYKCGQHDMDFSGRTMGPDKCPLRGIPGAIRDSIHISIGVGNFDEVVKYPKGWLEKRVAQFHDSIDEVWELHRWPIVPASQKDWDYEEDIRRTPGAREYDEAVAEKSEMAVRLRHFNETGQWPEEIW